MLLVSKGYFDKAEAVVTSVVCEGGLASKLRRRAGPEVDQRAIRIEVYALLIR